MIIGSAKNPIASVLCPLVMAVAAGNGVLARPSDVLPRCAKVVQTFINSFLDNRFYHCFLGTKLSPERLSQLPLDMICFSGSEDEAKSILAIASQNLIPVHLEIEKPIVTIVDASADITLAATK